MKKWWAMVGIVAVAVVILAVCLYGLQFDTPAIYPSGTGNSQLGTSTDTVPTTTEETLPWRSYGSISYIEDEIEEVKYEFTVQMLPDTVENPDGLQERSIKNPKSDADKKQLEESLK